MLIRSPKELSQLFQSLRKQAGINQSEVASRVGLKQSTVSNFEVNSANTRLETLFRILSALELELDVKPKKDKSKGSIEW